MAIHDDNWTKEIPDMYTYSKRDRWSAGGMAALILLAVTLPFFPSLYNILQVPLVIAFIVAAAATITYFLRIALTGRDR